MSTRGLAEHRFLQDQVVLLGLEDLLDHAVGALDHRGQLFVLALVQVFLELAALALQVAVLVDQLALAPRCARSRRSVGASLSSFSPAAFRRLPSSVRSFSRLRELGLELGLRRLRRHRVAQHAVAVDVADLQLLGLTRAAATASEQPPRQAAISGCGCSSERGPDLELKPLDSIFRLLADRRAVAELQRAHRRDPADRPTPAEARRLSNVTFSSSPQTLPAST